MESNEGECGAGKELLEKMDSLRAILLQAITVRGGSSNMREVRKKMKAERDAVVEFYRQHQAQLSVDNMSLFSKLFTEAIERVDEMLMCVRAKVEEMEKEEKNVAEREMKIKMELEKKTHMSLRRLKLQ